MLYIKVNWLKQENYFLKYQDYEMFSINWIQQMLLVLHNLSDSKEDFF